MDDFKSNAILVIDDDTWMQKVLKKIFDKMEIVQVHSALNGFDGVNIAIEEQPDIIFLDLFMPELDGYTILKLLKKIKLTQNIPVIIITSNSDFESVGTIISLGASEFVAKPFTFTTVIEKVKKVLGTINRKNETEESESATVYGFDYSQLDDNEYEFFSKFDITSNNHNTPNAKVVKPNIKSTFTEKYNKNADYTGEIKKLLK